MLIGRARLQNAALRLTNSSVWCSVTQTRCNLAEPGVARRNCSAMLDVRLGRTAPEAKFVKDRAAFWSLALPISNHPFDALDACSGQAFHQSLPQQPLP